MFLQAGDAIDESDDGTLEDKKSCVEDTSLKSAVSAAPSPSPGDGGNALQYSCGLEVPAAHFSLHFFTGCHDCPPVTLPRLPSGHSRLGWAGRH